MSDHIQQAIDSLEQEIEAIDQRRGELQRAIDAMRPLADSGREHKHSGKRNKKIPARTAAKRNKRTNERTSKARANNQTARRNLPNDAKHEVILEALRATSPQSPSELARVLKMPRPRLTAQLKPLLKSGAVVATGGGPRNRQFSLPGRRAKEGP